MKKTPILLVGIFCFLLSNTLKASSFTNPVSLNVERLNEYGPVLPLYFPIEEFLQMSPKEYEKITGKKLSFFQKIAFRLQQRKLKKMIQNDGPSFLSDFEATGFVLGLFMSIVGIGISYLIDYKETKKWAWRGAAIGGIFILIALLL